MPADAIFTPDHLAEIIKTTIPDLQPGITHVVMGTVDQTGAQVVASFKRTDYGVNWELQGAARFEWSGASTVEGKVMVYW